MSQAISDDLYAISHQAVGKVRPGATVKEQINAAWLNLGKPPMWRLRSAWWRDGSADWSAKAVEDFQRRFREWRERQTRDARSALATEALIRQQRDAAALEKARREHLAAIAQIELRLSVLGHDRGDT